MEKHRGIKTATSSFGTSGKISHDSSKFYGSRLYAQQPELSNHTGIECLIPQANRDRIFCKSSEVMDELPDSCVHLMITSPPYNVSKEYDENFTLDEYRALLRAVFSETYRLLDARGNYLEQRQQHRSLNGVGELEIRFQPDSSRRARVYFDFL